MAYERPTAQARSHLAAHAAASLAESATRAAARLAVSAPRAAARLAVSAPRAAASRLRRTALTGFQAVCEALFPDNDLGAPSWREAEMVERAATLWDELPPESALLLQSLYAGLELGGSLLAPGIGPLSKLPVERRIAMLKRWKAGIFPMRFLAEAIKSSATMVYMSHPRVSAFIGASKACGSVASHGQPVKANAFAGLMPRAEKTTAKRGAP